MYMYKQGYKNKLEIIEIVTISKNPISTELWHYFERLSTNLVQRQCILFSQSLSVGEVWSILGERERKHVLGKQY